MPTPLSTALTSAQTQLTDIATGLIPYAVAVAVAFLIFRVSKRAAKSLA